MVIRCLGVHWMAYMKMIHITSGRMQYLMANIITGRLNHFHYRDAYL